MPFRTVIVLLISYILPSIITATPLPPSSRLLLSLPRLPRSSDKGRGVGSHWDVQGTLELHESFDGISCSVFGVFHTQIPEHRALPHHPFLA
ncbi:hypothetical protein AALP_AAs51418U000200 [Arabis alpina]|uniref:Secreted protein n=1 Tax=Arabis alpina TaxID=50452 RepID=A0A087FZ79_ARAAL|nr:hypothetical protein AALP_AAs51418U000200 [Arabis alpina]